MNDRRSELSAILHAIPNVKKVYYQPPNGTQMKECPRIIYKREDIDNVHANNLVYLQRFKWQIKVVDKNPDSDVVQAVSLIPGISFDRHYATDGLNYDVFTLFF